MSAITFQEADAIHPAQSRMSPPSRVGDRAFPWLRNYPFPFLKQYFGWIPLFTGPIYGPCMFAGGIIIAIMILPIITSVSREILRSVPDLQREAAYALGATRWEATRIAVLSYAKKGLFGAVILGRW